MKIKYRLKHALPRHVNSKYSFWREVMYAYEAVSEYLWVLPEQFLHYSLCFREQELAIKHVDKYTIYMKYLIIKSL